MFSRTFPYPYAVFRSDLREFVRVPVNEEERTHKSVSTDVILPDLGIEFSLKSPEEDRSMAIEIYGVHTTTVDLIANHIDCYAPGYTLKQVIESGFDVVSESLLQATHYVCTEVDLFELGDSHSETFEFLLEIARSRFDYGS